MSVGLFESIYDLLYADQVLDYFGNSAFKTESEYLKSKRAELIAKDKKYTKEEYEKVDKMVNEVRAMLISFLKFLRNEKP